MPTPDDYKTARNLALKALAGADLDACCKKADIALERLSTGENKISIPFLTKTYDLIQGKDGFAFDERDHTVKLMDQVLLLHYLIEASGNPVADKWITFREVPSGPFYHTSFVKRAITPLVNCFGNEPDGLEKVATKMGKHIEAPGDVTLKVMALPRVPVVLSLWRGDDEFPPEGNVYFDASVSSYLPTEDIAYLAGSVVYTTIGLYKRLSVSQKGPIG